MTDSVPDEDDTDSLADGHRTIAPIMEELRRLRDVFDAKIRYDEAQERLVQSMSDELAQYRQDLYQNLLRPVLLDLVAMYDDLTQVIDAPEVSEATAGSLGFFRDTVEQVLARNGVHKFTVEDDAVDRSRQRVLSTVDTADARLRRHVAERLRVGFAWDEKVLRPEWVSTYRHVAQETTDPDAVVHSNEEGVSR